MRHFEILPLWILLKRYSFASIGSPLKQKYHAFCRMNLFGVDQKLLNNDHNLEGTKKAKICKKMCYFENMPLWIFPKVLGGTYRLKSFLI